MTDKPKDSTAAIKALVKAQMAMTRAMKDSNNPFFNSKYADLVSVQDACLPALHENGFAVMHSLGLGKDDNRERYVFTTLLHESGQSWECAIPLRVDKDNMQAVGSAITYARRYGLMCLSGVAPEDDDGNKAAANPPKKEKPESKPPEDIPPPSAAAIPPPSAEAIEDTIHKMKRIWDEAELPAFWNSLAEFQPGMQSAPGVAEAKDAQKLEIGAKAAIEAKAKERPSDSVDDDSVSF